MTFLDNEVTDNGPQNKANPFVMRGRKAAGLLREKMTELLKGWFEGGSAFFVKHRK